MTLNQIFGSGNVRLSLVEASDRLRESLSVCLPTTLRRWLIPRERYLTVVPDGGHATLYLADGDDRQLAGDLEKEAQTPLSASLSRSPKQRQDYPSMIELTADQVLTRKVSFPAQVRDSLDRVMGFEMDRLSPFEPGEILFDYRIDGSRTGGDRLHVELALCRRDAVDDWLERLRRADAPAVRVAWDGAWPKANLLPPQDRPRKRHRLFSPNNVLVLLLILLAAAAMATPLWQKTRIQELLDAEVRSLRARVIEVDEVRQALEQARKGSVEVLRRKSEQPLMVDLLQTLTGKLPDDTWVQTLNVKDGQVEVRGESAQATALIAQLEQAQGFSGVSFRSPVTQDARTGKERFNIAFQYARPREQ